MKLFKYLFWVLILLGSLVFLVQLNELNQFDGVAMTIKIPYLLDIPGYEDGFNVWLVLVMVLTVGVFIGFILGFFQIISQKKEIFSLKSQLKQIQVELDGLRNQNIEDDIEILDEMSENIYD